MLRVNPNMDESKVPLYILRPFVVGTQKKLPTPGVPDTWSELLYALVFKHERTNTYNASTFVRILIFGFRLFIATSFFCGTKSQLKVYKWVEGIIWDLVLKLGHEIPVNVEA
ncbi:hypothetical protein M0R45_005662 [Rubus argutus]|uniref:Uncharacterized protein n=1 Tax=Rubus argutus TaxID=59490 RepID=A0AAW1YN83_RUBAR